MKNKMFPLITLIVGIILAVYGIVTPGLFPFALPACILGGFMIGNSIFNLFNKE